MDSRPSGGETFVTWFAKWLEMLRQTDAAGAQPIDDNIECACVRRAAPRELGGHLMLHENNTHDKWIKMHESVVKWNILRKDWKGLAAVSPDETAMQIGALGSPCQPQGWNNEGNYAGLVWF